jgi:hypothetical protein
VRALCSTCDALEHHIAHEHDVGVSTLTILRVIPRGAWIWYVVGRKGRGAGPGCRHGEAMLCGPSLHAMRSGAMKYHTHNVGEQPQRECTAAQRSSKEGGVVNRRAGGVGCGGWFSLRKKNQKHITSDVSTFVLPVDLGTNLGTTWHRDQVKVLGGKAVASYCAQALLCSSGGLSKPRA